MKLDVRDWQPADDAGLVAILSAQMRADPGWPPDYARGGDLAEWLGAPATLGRWVAIDAGGLAVGHVGSAPVHPGPLAELWQAAIGCEIDRMAEVCRLVVAIQVRRHGISGLLTRKALRASIERGRFAQFGVIGCWTTTCSIRSVCDLCHKLRPSFDLRHALADAP